MADQGVCATEGCDNHATNQFIRGGVGSTYCGDCFVKVIEACETTRPAEQAVTEAMNQLALIHSLANDITEHNYADKRLYILQTCVRLCDTLTTALGAQTPPEGETQGWQLVPKRITPAMEDAHFQAHAEATTVFAEPQSVWAYMLAAAPTPPVNQSEGADRGRRN